MNTVDRQVRLGCEHPVLPAVVLRLGLIIEKRRLGQNLRSYRIHVMAITVDPYESSQYKYRHSILLHYVAYLPLVLAPKSSRIFREVVCRIDVEVVHRSL